ncbi:hypothetical protein [Streptomyces malaysiensis]|uniref:hypothetical protein n=1 Tax=Streptomyces malaysiensis TaxID=92644 RepID=UPI001AD91EBF|nr:hypothetical protein [Streptomyces malaysiensis]
MQELLMGEELYGDRGLAVRELYQNALDACRYREARTTYLQRTGQRVEDWAGLIEFVQGVDDARRPYLECRGDIAALRELLTRPGQELPGPHPAHICLGVAGRLVQALLRELAGEAYPFHVTAERSAGGTQLLAHAGALLDEDKTTSGELRFLARRLVEALTDALRVAESRGGRLLVRGEQGADERNQDDQ